MQMVDTKLNLSLARQCEILSLPRSSFYYKASSRNSDSWLMNEIQELWMKCPFYGYRRITAVLNRDGYAVNRKRIQRLMRAMKLQAIYPKQTSMSNKQHLKYPYLLGELDITRPNHVWSTDLTYLKMQKGFLYLVALIDVFSRYILSWELSISMDTEFCISMLESALSKNSPKIINTDQGSQFTSKVWMAKAGVLIMFILSVFGDHSSRKKFISSHMKMRVRREKEYVNILNFIITKDRISLWVIKLQQRFILLRVSIQLMSCRRKRRLSMSRINNFCSTRMMVL